MIDNLLNEQRVTLAILLVTPLLLIEWRWPHQMFKRQRIAITLGLFLVVAFLTEQSLFPQWFHEIPSFFVKGYWLMLFVVLVTFNEGYHSVLLIIAMMAVQALIGAESGIGVEGHDFIRVGWQNFWFALLILTLAGISLAINVGQRKRAKQALREPESQLKVFFDNSPVGIQVFDLHGKILMLNRAARQIFGITHDAPPDSHGLFDDPTISDDIKRTLRQGQSAWEEFRNDQLFFSRTFTPCFNENKQLAGYIASIIDVTDRKFDEAQIEKLNSVYAVLAQTNRIARQTKSQSELFSAVCRIVVETGRMKMAWIGMADEDSDLIRPVACYGANIEYLDDIVVSGNPDIPEGRGPVGTAFREGRAMLLQDFESSPLTEPWKVRAHHSGNWHSCAAFPIVKGGRPHAVLAIYHAEKNAFNELLVSLLTAMVADIGFTLDAFDTANERERVVEEFRLSEERFRTLNDLLPDQIWTARPDGHLDYVNQRVLEYFDRTFDEMIEDGWQQIVHPDDLPGTLAIWSESLQTGRSYEVEFRLRHRSGEYRWCLARALAGRDDSGRIVQWYGINTDIMERKQNEERQRLTARVFDTTLEGIMITDADCNLIEVNEAFTVITGYSGEEVKGKNPRILKSGHQDVKFYQMMWQAITTTGHWSGEIWNRRKNGEVYPEWSTISAIIDDKGEISHYVGISSDITLLKQHEKQLEHIAHYDALTGIPNRVLLVDRMQQALAHTRREHKLMLICYLDLDGFKPINDTLGHDAGDQVLIEITKRITGSLRGGDTVARLGGDEFVILLLDIESTDECNKSLDRLLAVIARPIVIQGQPFNVTGSIGVTLYPIDDEDPDTLLRHADQAMYQAKQAGKNRYHVFDPDEGMRLRMQSEQKAVIEEAFQYRQFELFYQPKIALADHRIVGVEALIRWRHPERGLLPPNEFLPMIENTELDVQLGEWVVGTALRQMARWHRAGLMLEVSINVSANHLQSAGFISKLQQKMALYPDLPPHQLQIEILETAALHDIAAVSDIMRACATIGVDFALDDFGTGYSSLAYLRRLPANTLKIDQSFVRDMLTDGDDHSIVQGVIALADTFNRTTVAEGVETQEHYEALRALGCDIGQGFGIARPMPADEIPCWCRDSQFNPALSL